MKVGRFEELVAWQKARELTKDIYSITKAGSFAKDFGLRDQICRAAVSIGSNIAEGFDRGNNREFVVFLGIAKGSAAEVRSQLYVALDVGYVTNGVFEKLRAKTEEVSRLICGLIASIRKVQGGHRVS